MATILTALNFPTLHSSATTELPEPFDHVSSRAAGPAYKHVLLINIDGFRNADLQDPLLQPDMPNIMSLTKSGVTYTNAFTSPLSDSYPGLMNLITGASPKSTGIYYDVEYSRSLYPPTSTGTNVVTTNGNTQVFDINGVNITNSPGSQVNFAENIDINSDLGSGGGSPGFNASSIDTTLLPVSFTNGKLVPVFPHSYLKVNTIFEVAHAAGMRTAYCDKHAGAYEIVNGPSGAGCDDFYGVESDAFQIATQNPDGTFTVTDKAKSSGGLKPKSNLNVSLGQDDLKIQAVLNQIQGKDSRGNAAPVPVLFGTEILSLSTAEKMVKDSNGILGGIDGTAANEIVNPGMHTALQHIDTGIGKIITALKNANLFSSTLIIISAKHGQTPRIGQPNVVSQNNTNVDPFVDALNNAGIGVGNEDQDTIANIWLTNQSQLSVALNVLNGLKSNASLQIKAILSNGSFPAGFGDPTKDDRTPDISVQLNPGSYEDNTPSGKRAEHGGLSDDETHVACIVSGAGLTGTTNSSTVSTRQVAVTALQALGLDPTKLQGAVAESTIALPNSLPGVNGGPVVTTAASATPTTAGIGQTVTFGVAAADVFPLTVSWTFGDNSTGTGTAPTHAYTAAGTYTATASISDGTNPAVTSAVTVKVVAPLAGVGIDTDGDGFSDAIEIAAGSDPKNAASTPFGSAGPGTPVTLSLKSVGVKLNFKKSTSNDSIQFQGSLPVPSGFTFSGQKVVVDVSGVATAFTLDAKGHSLSGGNNLVLTKPGKDGTSKFLVKLTKGTFQSILNNAGLVNSNEKDSQVTIVVTVLFNKTDFTVPATLTYTAKKGATGIGKGK